MNYFWHDVERRAQVTAYRLRAGRRTLPTPDLLALRVGVIAAQE
jgi:hypothetical protein